MHTAIRSIIKRLSSSVTVRKAAGVLSDGLMHQPHILFFHGVQSQILDPRLQVLHTPLDGFEYLIKHLKRNFNLIDADELHHRLQSKRPDLHRCVLLTFDDGYQDNATLLAPLLKSLDIPFTIYLTTSCIGTEKRLPTFVARAALYHTNRSSCFLPAIDGEIQLKNEEQRAKAVAMVSAKLKRCPTSIGFTIVDALKELLSDTQWSEINQRYDSDKFMTWDEVKETVDAGAVIGAHGHDHFPLHQNQSLDEIRFQINESKRLVSEHLGECRHYAFPNGQQEDISRDAVSALANAGFDTATTTVPGSLYASENPLLLPRSCVDSVEALQRRVLRCRFDNSRRDLRILNTELS